MEAGNAGAESELKEALHENKHGRHGIRAAVIFSYLFPEYTPALTETILNPTSRFDTAFSEEEVWRNKYMPMFLRLHESELDPCDVSRALDYIAVVKTDKDGKSEYGKPGTLYLAFATLIPSNQLVNATKVAKYLFDMKNEYYLAKFFFYWRRILGYTDHTGMNRMFVEGGLTEKWLDDWLDGMRQEGREKLAQYAAVSDNGLLSSPDSAIIKDRDGESPQFIVLHSAGAGSPDERVRAMFTEPNCGVTAHFFVTTSGLVFKFVDLKDAAKTNRTDDDPERDTYYRLASHEFFRRHSKNANNFTVAIEHEEFGAHGSLSLPQYKATLRLLNQINRECGIPIDNYHVIGHGDISPLEKGFCPGRNFPRRQLIQDFRAQQEAGLLSPARVLNPAELI